MSDKPKLTWLDEGRLPIAPLPPRPIVDTVNKTHPEGGRVPTPPPPPPPARKK